MYRERRAAKCNAARERQLTTARADQGAANGEAETHSVRLARHEWLEQRLSSAGANTRARVIDAQDHSVRAGGGVQLNAPGRRGGLREGIDRIGDEVMQDDLDLHAVAGEARNR